MTGIEDDAKALSGGAGSGRIQGYVAANDTANACSELKSFIKNVTALATSKKLNAVQAASLVTLAKAIEKTLGC